MSAINTPSDIDLVYSRLYNNAALFSGMSTALITTLALCRICNFVNPTNQSFTFKAVVYTSAITLGVATGHFVTTQVIGLIAKSTLGKMAFSLIFNGIGSLVGITLHQKLFD